MNNKVLESVFVCCLVLISACVFCACGKGTDSGAETNFETKSPEASLVEKDDSHITSDPDPRASLPKGVNPKSYYKFVEFDIPKEDFRQAAVNHMKKMASVQWKAAATMDLREKFPSWGISVYYVKGVTYYGLPYTNLHSTFQEFIDEIAPDGVFGSDESSWERIIGAQCCTSVLNALQQFTNTVEGETHVFIPDFDTCQVKKLGNYKSVSKTTSETIKENDEQTMYESYALLQTGDVFVKRVNGANHIGIVAKNATVVRDSSGKIDPSKSFIVTMEQASSFDSSRKDIKTTWRVEAKRAFIALRNDGYIPVTLSVYETNKTEIPYIAYDKAVSKKGLESGQLSGNIKTNYPLRYITLEIVDSQGVSVSRTRTGDMTNVKTFSLQPYGKLLFEGVSAGDYKLKITAGIAVGSAELLNVDFTYKG